MVRSIRGPFWPQGLVLSVPAAANALMYEIARGLEQIALMRAGRAG